MNTEIQTTQEISITNPPKIKVPAVDVMVPTTMAEVKIAEKNLAIFSKARTSFVNEFKPFKQQVDEIKARLLSFEKEQVAIISEIEAKQDKAITDFKTQILRDQRAVIALDAEVRGKLSKTITDLKNLLVKITAWEAQVNVKILEKENIPLAEKIDDIEEAKEIAKEIAGTVIPEVEIKPMTSFGKKKDFIKTNLVYEIENEEKVIEWAMANGFKNLLKVEIKKGEFNKLPKDVKKSIPGVVEKEEV